MFLDAGIMPLRNIGILPYHYTSYQHKRPRLDHLQGEVKTSENALRNFGILPHPYTALRPRIPRFEHVIRNFTL